MRARRESVQKETGVTQSQMMATPISNQLLLPQDPAQAETGGSRLGGRVLVKQ